MTALVGIDLGTTCVRVGLFDADGRRLAMAVEAVETRHPGPGRAEQDAETWWPAVCAATRRAVGEAGIEPRSIAGIALSSTASTVVLLDAADRVLAPAVLWMDVRAADEAARTKLDRPVLRYSGGSDAAEWLVPKAMWLRSNEPALWDRAVHVVEALDYMTWRLTGDWVASLLTATCKWNYDPVIGSFDDRLFDILGVPDLLSKLPSRVEPMGAMAGRLTATAATGLGLLPGVPVAVGGVDAHMAVPGTGALALGSMCLIGGTSVVLLRLASEARYGAGIWGPYPDVYGRGTWLLEGGQVSAGSILTWYRDSLGLDDHEPLMAAADKVPKARSGLLALDFFQGNRTPYRDERLRGALLGLDLHHGPGDIYRALVEGVAYGTRNAAEAIEELGGPVAEIVASGGIRRNRTWLQATADVLQRPIVLPAETEASVFGAAVVASVAAGVHATLDAAASAMVRRERVVEPDILVRQAYDEGFMRYRAASAALAATLHELAAIADGSAPGAALEAVGA